MIGVAGVTFSLTMVVLSLTASQYGPRLLGSFMRDTGNQIVLGMFIATYLYCLLILRTVNSTDGEAFFVPNLSIAVAVLLAVASLAVFIYFIHHTAASIRAGTVISNVSGELHAAIKQVYKHKFLSTDEAPDLPADFAKKSRELVSKRTGYLQTFQTEPLVTLARKHDLIIQLTRHAGEFVGVGETFVQVYPSANLDDELANNLLEPFAFSAHRAGAREFEVLFNQLVEIALRALSSGVNDPFTAVMCLDRLGEALSLFLERDQPVAYYLDDDKLRVLTQTQPAVELIRSTLGPIRHYASRDLIVLRRFIETVRLVMQSTQREDELNALKEQARLAATTGHDHLPHEDYLLLDKVYRAITKSDEANSIDDD